MPATGLLLNTAHRFDINTTPATTETLAQLGAGFSSFDVSFNEESDQTKYLDGDGWGSTTVTGGQVTLTFSGHRLYGDAAQDFIFDKMLELGTARETTFKWTLPNGDTLEGAVTIAVIEGMGGDAGAKGEISVEIHFNGKPTFTAGV
jgi:tail tube protein